MRRRRAPMSTGSWEACRAVAVPAAAAGGQAKQLEQAQDIGGNKARARRVHVPVAIAALRLDVKSVRQKQMQMILGAGHGDVKQPPLFLDLRAGSRGKIGRDAAVDGD